MLEFEGFFKPKRGRVEVRKVTILIGSESVGTLNVGRLLAAAVLASKCKDPYFAFKRCLGLSIPELFENNGFVKFDGFEVDIGSNELHLKRGRFENVNVHIAPALRAACISSLSRLVEYPFDVSLMTNILAEVMPCPVKLFLASIVGIDACKALSDFYITKDLVLEVLDKLGLKKIKLLGSGEVDRALIKYFEKVVKPNDILVVEEPSIFKSLKQTYNEMEEVLKRTYMKDVYVVVGTSRLASVYAVNMLIEKGVINAQDVKAYHVTEGGVEELEVSEGLGVLLENVEFSADIAD